MPEGSPGVIPHVDLSIVPEGWEHFQEGFLDCGVESMWGPKISIGTVTVHPSEPNLPGGSGLLKDFTPELLKQELVLDMSFLDLEPALVLGACHNILCHLALTSRASVSPSPQKSVVLSLQGVQCPFG